jgi:hypothetical protein
MQSNATIYLFDIDTVQDPINGERTRSVKSFKKIIGELSEVGANTFWNAHSNNVNLAATVQIFKQAYKNNKFIYIKSRNMSEVYEVNNIAKGESFEKVRLNLTVATDEDLKELIENAIS